MGTKRKPRKSGCTARFGLLLVISLCFLCIAAYGKFVYLPQAELQENMTKWQTKGSSTYRITIVDWVGSERRNTVYIHNGQTIFETQPYRDSLFTEPPIETFFKKVSSCVGSIFSCSVEYDPNLGFPTAITWPCLDACPVFHTSLVDLELNPHFEEF